LRTVFGFLIDCINASVSISKSCSSAAFDSMFVYNCDVDVVTWSISLGYDKWVMISISVTADKYSRNILSVLYMQGSELGWFRGVISSCEKKFKYVWINVFFIIDIVLVSVFGNTFQTVRLSYHASFLMSKDISILAIHAFLSI
jgi:hypothetical protein